jgi:S1-C subfamily serine protease
MLSYSRMSFRLLLFIATLLSVAYPLWAQTVPRIDTFPAPNGKWSIDHYSKDNGWEKSFLALRLPDSSTIKRFATIDAAIQGAPIWSPDSRLVVFNTGYSTYLEPKLFQISESGTVKEIDPFATLFAMARRSGRIPKSEEEDYETGHHYLRGRYFDDATKAFWFTYYGDYALKRPGKPEHVQREFVVSLDLASLSFKLHDDLPRAADPTPPPRAAAFGLRATGTGFVIDRAGHVMTCNHVVEGAAFIKVDSETASYDAVVAFTDNDLDVAVLQVIKLPTIEPLPLGLTTRIDLADDVFTIGFPNTTIQGFSPKYTRGEISALAGLADDPHLVQISTPVQPGNSGGALVSSDGTVVGIVAAKLNAAMAARVTGDIAQNVNYALKVKELLPLIQKWGLTLPVTKPTANRKEAVQCARQATLRISVYGMPISE